MQAPDIWGLKAPCQQKQLQTHQVGSKLCYLCTGLLPQLTTFCDAMDEPCKSMCDTAASSGKTVLNDWRCEDIEEKSQASRGTS